MCGYQKKIQIKQEELSEIKSPIITRLVDVNDGPVILLS